MRLFGRGHFGYRFAASSPAAPDFQRRHGGPCASAGTVAALLVAAGCCAPAIAQAPYVLPYTISTYAGGQAQYTIGAACSSNSSLLALDAAGDGCLAPGVSVGTDPHDVRVDGLGNVFYIDNTTSAAIIHRINPFTQFQIAYVGSTVNSKACYSATTGSTINSSLGVATKIGDDCPASDGVANTGNSNPTYTTLLSHNPRGLGVSANGDLYWAGYNDYLDHKVSASLVPTTLGFSNFMSLVIGGGSVASGSVTTPTRYSQTDGTIAQSTEYQSRGISGADAAGNVYVADTGDNVIRKVTAAGIVSTITGSSNLTTGIVVAGGNTSTTGIPATTTNQLYNPEDVQVDPYGNIYIADAGNGVIRAIYEGKGSLIGYNAASLTTGYMYTIAGYSYVYSSATYPPTPTPTPASAATNGISPTYAPRSILFASPRKIAFDALGNLYIADSGTTANATTGEPAVQSNVVYFLDAATGQMRVLAGSYGQSAAATPVCTTGSNGVGDGCPATLASLFPNSDMGTAPDSLGNLYITDAEGGAAVTAGRIRKVLSGLNFPSITTYTSTTQTVLMHFAPGDTPAAANPYTITTGAPFTLVGTPVCAVANDTTDDCLLKISFAPTQPGLAIATLTVASTKGAVSAFQLTGTGSGPAIVFDPGNTSLLAATPSNPQGIAVDGAGNAYIADTANNRVLFYSAASGSTTIFAGGGSASCAGHTDAFGDGCLATASALKGPRAVAIGNAGTIFIADTGNNVIRAVSPATGLITLYAGAGTVCAQNGDSLVDSIGDGCLALNTTFSSPSGLAADNLGNLFVADTGNNVIRLIASNTSTTLFAGIVGSTTATCSAGNQGNGCAALAASFNAPTGIAFDSTGKYLFVADTGNSTVRKIYLGTTFGYTGSTTLTKASNVLLNPITLVAGNGQAGASVDQNNLATLSQLNVPTGVAVDAAENVYIADTGNHAIRLVNAASGVLSTLAGITGASGTGTVGGAASSTQLNLPGAVAVTNAGNLFIADSGNNRIISDLRSQIVYNFGRVNVNASSPIQSFTELNIGNTAAVIPTPSTTNTQFTLTAAANSNNSIPACAAGSAVAGAICGLQGQFSPTGGGFQSVTYAETLSNSTAPPNTTPPSITLSGTGAVLTTTTSTVAQTAPVPPANSQFGGSLTLTTTVAPASCNTAAPACYPGGTVIFVIDNVQSAPIPVSGAGTVSTASDTVTGLSVGPHTVSCNYSGDNFYAASTCGSGTITVIQSSTASTLTATNNNQPQFTTVLLTASVASLTTGQPTGTVNFLANGALLNATPAPLNANGIATFTLSAGADPNGNPLATNNTLAPGTYTLTCVYSGSANFASSNCHGITFTVLPQVASLGIPSNGTKPCVASSLYPPGTFTPALSQNCTAVIVPTPAVPTVAVAQGSTTDATIFLIPSNTLSGTLTFSCSGMPAAASCTFSPTSIPLTPSIAYSTPVFFDVTFFNDVQPGSVPGVATLRPPVSGTARTATPSFAAFQSTHPGLWGWPLTLAGLACLLGLRRRRRGVPLLAMLLLLAGSTLTFTSCAGPGSYKAVLTPAGTYPITITATNGTVSVTTVVDYTVTAPGITGQE